MPYLILFSIGPVQEFIASARRSRDLWFGSWVLSEVSKTVAREIHAAAGTLIFPAPASPNDDLKPDSPMNVANKILAELPNSAPTPATLAQKITVALEQRLLDQIWAKAYQHIRRHDQIDATAAHAQIKELIEMAWVAVPMEAGTYADARDMLEHLMAARKTTRAFAPVGDWSQAGRPKSSLDGLRESVIPEHVYDQLDELDLFRKFGVRRGERLCGVGLLKRHGQREDRSGGRVFSTSHIAALPLLDRLETSHQSSVNRYIGFLQGIGLGVDELGNVPGAHPIFRWWNEQRQEWMSCDGHLLFEERLSEYITSNVQLHQAKTELAILRKAINNGPDFTPLPYYALLLADGDGMGKAIEVQTSQADHRRLSQQLAGFAQQVASIVANHNGSLVYAGGDDVLAFVPLHSVLTCARTLADRFRSTMHSFGYHDDQGITHTPTLSVGIAIAHHLEPLTDAFALAREAEQHAKTHPGKNALAVAVSKRSGEDRTVVGSWDNDGTVIGTLEARLIQFVDWYATGALPDGLAFELAQLHRRLYPSRNPALAAALQPPLRDAAKRILTRKRTDQAGRLALDAQHAALLERLIEQLPLNQLAEELIVARIFASALRQTGKTAYHMFTHALKQSQEAA